MCAVFQAVFVMTIILVSQPKSKPMTQATMAGLGLLTFYQYLIHVVVHEKAILNMLGMFMFVVATVTWATPVMEIRDCMKKQSSANISVSMLIGGIACATMWLFYGLLLNDFYIYSPNIVGLATSAGKVVCVMKYGSKKRTEWRFVYIVTIYLFIEMIRCALIKILCDIYLVLRYQKVKFYYQVTLAWSCTYF